MKNLIILSGLLLLSFGAQTQSRFSKQEISINAFRNPSIGLEYRYRAVSLHAGYYVTNFETNVTTKFLKTGVTLWFLPIGKRDNPSSFYAQLSYLRGLNRDYENKNAASIDVGLRYFIWKGLHARLGVAAVFGADESVKINPTPSIGYAFSF